MKNQRAPLNAIAEESLESRQSDTDNDNDQFEQEYEKKGELDRPVIKIDTPAKNEDSSDDCAQSNEP